jgi:hypothetical protein
LLLIKCLRKEMLKELPKSVEVSIQLLIGIPEETLKEGGPIREFGCGVHVLGVEDSFE